MPFADRTFNCSNRPCLIADAKLHPVLVTKIELRQKAVQVLFLEPGVMPNAIASARSAVPPSEATPPAPRRRP
jgi:hypothetical protein